MRRLLLLTLGTEEAVDNVSLCANPNILQLSLLCCRGLDEVGLHSTSNITNTPIVHICFPSIGRERNYDATKWQLRIISDAFEYGTYRFEDILTYGASLSSYYLDLPGRNWIPLLRIRLGNDVKGFLKRYPLFTNRANE